MPFPRSGWPRKRLSLGFGGGGCGRWFLPQGESRGSFGHDFGHVRIHDGAAAHAATEAFDAKGFAWGRHVVLSPAAGSSTLAHELAHVVQQSGAGADAFGIAPAGGALERDAAVAAGSGQPPCLRTAARQVQRDGPLGQIALSRQSAPSSTRISPSTALCPWAAGWRSSTA